ncbi:MAG: DNA alkylation repair protein [Candidatus Omnitrophica bacterium]|nr:DNA alkylation repair protein [Candidatus Omnitrophota bacterium]
MSVHSLKKDLRKYADPKKAKILQRFFKTGQGEYGEGDVFLGVKVPDTRRVAKNHKGEPLEVIDKLIQSEIHEERLLALLLLIEKFNTANPIERQKFFKFYITCFPHINNWDLVDLSAPKIVGQYLFGQAKKKQQYLIQLAHSQNLWEKRIAIISTAFFIQQNKFGLTLAISKILLNDQHDLIHKAVGWMLREVGKRDIREEEEFLKKHYQKMPRTMLRYAIEKFEEKKRQDYLKNRI